MRIKEFYVVNLAGVDLNLLIVFDALMAQHVTRAGERIGLSQPALSCSIKSLAAFT